MNLLTLIVVIVIVGVLLWAINSFIPLDPKIRTILNVVVVIFLVIWILSATGILGPIGNVRLGNGNNNNRNVSCSVVTVGR